MVAPDLRVEGVRLSLLGSGDAPALQDLYERCTDYHELHEGTPTRPTVGRVELATVPVGKSLDDKFAFGIHDASGLIGFLDVIRDFPRPRVWWIGLLLLDPEARRRTLGSRIVRAVLEWTRGGGAHSLQLGVMEQNPDAERFWRRHGFEEVRRQPHTSDTGYRSRIIVMRRPLDAAPGDTPPTAPGTGPAGNPLDRTLQWPLARP